MSELLFRGWNVAVPEIDLGDDIFVVRDATGELTRVQVKTANLDGQTAQFKIKIAQLQKEVRPKMVFAFVVRKQDRWLPFLLIRQTSMMIFFENGDFGEASGAQLNLRIRFDGQKIQAGKAFRLDFTPFLTFENDFPPIAH